MPSMKSAARRVLVVDDDEDDVFFITRALRQSDCELNIEVASDGRDALDQLNDNRPDLVLLDLNLPGMNGREVLSTAKASNDLRLIPIIILSTSDSPRDIAACYASNANAYVTKPESPNGYTMLAETLNRFWFETAKLA